MAGMTIFEDENLWFKTVLHYISPRPEMRNAAVLKGEKES
jgi:hypothetical protein